LVLFRSLHNLKSKIQNPKLIDRPGKPKKGTLPSRITYHPQASLQLNSEVVKLHSSRAGRFILATNDLDFEQLSEQAALHEYKEQQGNSILDFGF